MVTAAPLQACRCANVFKAGFALAAAIFLPQILRSQPEVYFASASGQVGDTLKLTLRDIIDGHTSLSYTPGVWNAHKDLYEDPDNPNNIILFYSQDSISKALQDSGSSPSNYWNREHLWPRSYGVDDTSASNTDIFNLVPAYKGVNSDRNNNYFDYADPTASGYADPAHPLAPLCKEVENLSWEPADGQKGWVARAMFYMATRYSHLNLVSTPPSPAPVTNGTNMAQLSSLLIWNRQFGPTARERTVNQRIFDNYQHNRNPFIDYPEFADAIWVNGPSWGAWRLAHFSLTELLDETVSGDLQDPDGDGLANIIEMARYSDPRSPDSAPLVAKTVNSGSVELSFLRAADTAHLNLAISLQSSPDLVEWDTVPLTGATTDPAGPGQVTVTVTVALPPEGNPEFYRLTVIRP